MIVRTYWPRYLPYETAVIAKAGPKIPLPKVEPLILKPLATDDARAVNEKIPFVKEAIVPALPYHFAGDATARERAITCLAAAGWYEAGDDDRGQRAVMQVILNRARHPAYPSSVCGVVFQGSERRTGCQFTFTCDGALIRRPSAAALARSKVRATAMINGSVYNDVGLATHYHTDWVVPYWSAKLDKIAAVDTHLFFRWRGFWGTRKAFRTGGSANESPQNKIAFLSPLHAMTEDGNLLAVEDIDLLGGDELAGGEADKLALGPASGAAMPKGSVPQGQSNDGSVVLTQLPGGFAGNFAIDALKICSGKRNCVVAGWASAGDIPKSADPGTLARARPAFVFIQDRRQRTQKSLWDCSKFERSNPAQCMPTDPSALANLLKPPS